MIRPSEARERRRRAETEAANLEKESQRPKRAAELPEESTREPDQLTEESERGLEDLERIARELHARIKKAKSHRQPKEKRDQTASCGCHFSTQQS
jgi:hypothetical protein